MTRKDLPARAANIQRAVASPTTCTAATAESLRAYLMPPERPVQQHKKPSNARLPKVKGTPAPAAKKGGAGSRKPPTVTILEISGENENCVQPQDRFTFATEIINAILKSLTEAIKDPPTRKHPQAKRLPLARSSSSSPYPNGVESRSQTPLQPISVNRLASTPSKQCQNRRSSSTTSIKQTWDGLRAQAECARIGFATLRSLQDQKSLVLNLPFLQLETGMSALIGKMLSLGFEDLALRELRILKKRIDGAENATPGQNATRSISFRPGNEKSDSKTETLADLLMFRNTGVQGKMLALIISSQLQVLKLLALTGEASATEVVLQHLRLHVPYSPAILIQRQIESDVGGSPDKAAHQLEVLTQSLIALCPSASSKEDCRMAKSGPHSSAEVVFQIQVLAFQIRSTWWKIAGHRSDIAKDILEPFSRCLGAFHRRSSLERKERYDMAKRNFQIILGSVQNLDGFREEGLFSIYQSLTDLARENSQYLEAIEWSRKARRNAREGELSRTQLCSLKCRIASLEIQSLDLEPSDGVLDSVKDAAQGLEGDLQGGATELDELLIAVASLRRSAFSVFQNSHRSSKGNIKQQYSPLLVDECRNVVLLCVRFLVRYVGSESSKGESDNMTMRRDQRRRQASRVATTFIESFVAVARLSAQSDPDEWGKLEAGLQDCLIVASNLETVSSNENQISGEDEPTSSVFVSISIAYWVRYLHLKRETTDTKCLEKCLRMSIDPIKERSLSEKLAASLPMKLEKYGQLCDLMREHKKGVESYRQALDTHLGSGLLRVAVEAASTTSIQGVFHDDDELGPFFRILQAYPRIAMKAVKNSHSDNPFFDAEGLCNSERGLLLERQLISVLSFLNDRDPYPTSCEVLDKLATLLLSIYTNHEFPVRRLRVIVRLLYLLLTKHNALGDNLRHQVLQEPTIRPASDHYDTGLLGFLSHLTASRGVLVSLYERRPNLKDMELVVRSWSRLVQECPSLDMLQTHVYDIGDWLIQLELLAEYLNMQGLDLLRASVLHLSVAVHEAALSTQCSILISKLSALGLQYARLGYSSLAGVTLQKAQRYLEIYKVPIRITLRWHLSYAEYALLNGNLKCW